MPMGVMKRWNDKGFGFITPDDGGEDVFCHATGLLDGEGSVREGDEVTFKMEYDDRKGKDRAVKVEVARGGGGGRRRDPPPRSRSPPRGRDRDRSPPRRGGGGGGARNSGGSGTGKMLRWNEEKGFGFIKPDDGEEDLFCHKSGLLDGDGSVFDGDAVTFVKEFDDRKGKWRAVNVAVAGGGGGGGGRGGGGGGGRGRDSRSPPPRRGRY
eukprot:TRINITY_DN76899_c0_g1_i1.p1 TRINITY_DN76899_c0_g1~~TRINITY_DN76899_c0_g1_i1.p1  ORF type:complete len:210 (+),score=42.61 TRINITY_DN76899_c0_g1_i1:121-750(+)